MISFAKQEYSKKEINSLLHPFVKKWFSKFADLTPPQKYAVKLIHKRENVLISSPTGSGKTVSAFLSIISELFTLADSNELKDEVYCLYISPLKALNNDIKRNLEEPLKEIKSYQKNIPNIRVGVRTGDTTQKERVSHSKKPPHIYITTPESLAIIINSPKFKKKLENVKWLIIDEIHALCSNKRGVHLSLSIERLINSMREKPARIGLSATISPLETVAKYLSGSSENCKIVDISSIKKTNINLYAPANDLIYSTTDYLNKRFYDKLNNRIRDNRTTLIFTNTRSGTERVLFNLQERFKDYYKNNLAAHHSSLSKKQRHLVEEGLKNGIYKAVCSSTSLELGIDIGTIDLVIQVASPKSVSRLMQRVGRAGHNINEVSRGELIVQDRDDLIECAVMISEAYKNKIEKVKIPKNCLDVLSQHVVGMALNSKWGVEEAYKLVKGSYCYNNLSMEDFVSVLKYLSGKYYDLDEFHVYGKIWFDEIDNMFGRRGRLTRPIYFLNLGTIPSTSSVKVYCLENDGSKLLVGSLDEDFVERLQKNDRFVIGGKVYEFKRASGMVAVVTNAWDKSPTIPSWVSEMLPLSFELAVSICKFKEKLFNQLENNVGSEEVISEVMRESRCDLNAATAIYNYVKEQYYFLKKNGVNEYPSHNTILIEEYYGDNGLQNIIFHTLYGRKINDVLSRAYAFSAGRNLKKNVRITISDNGFLLTFPAGIRVKPSELISLVSYKTVERIVRDSLEKTEMLKRRFRHVASRSFMILKNYLGNSISVGKQQFNARLLLKISQEIAGFPIIKETYREILEDAMDLENAVKLLRHVDEKKINFVICPKSKVPSPFSHNLILKWHSDVVSSESRKEMLERLHRQVKYLIE
jgi:ATP-dependent Lhr-like helicase